MPWLNATASSLLTGLAKLPLLARNGVGVCLQPLNLRAFFQPEPCGEVLSMLSTPLKSISERFMSTFEDWVKPFKTWKSHEIPKSSQVSIIFPWIFSCTGFSIQFSGHDCMHSRGVSPGHVWLQRFYGLFSYEFVFGLVGVHFEKSSSKSIERIAKDKFEHNHLITIT